jgi:hypothetical protein
MIPAAIGSLLGLHVEPVEAMPEGRFFAFEGRPHVLYCHPLTYLRARIELEPGTTYAQRSTMHARLRWEVRRRKLKGTPAPTIEGLLALGRRCS